jgi:hypothetical protein
MRNLAEVCENVSTNVKNRGASNPTGSILAGIDAAEMVFLYILRYNQILSILTYQRKGRREVV